MAKKVKSVRPPSQETAVTPVTIYTDGSCKGTYGGYCALLTTPEGQSCVVRGNALDVTNNKMELQSIIESLNIITDTTRPIVVISDSAYAVDAINKNIKSWANNNWKTSTGQPVKNQEQMQYLHEAKKRLNLTAQWVRGHNGHPENEFCDEQAQKMADRIKEK